MNVLLTGASGLLGRYLIYHLPREGVDLWGTYNTHSIANIWEGRSLPMNLGDQASVYYAFNKASPDVVIHCAGEGNVDLCQKHSATTARINVIGTQIVLRAAAEYGARFVYLSSNAVFGGDDPPYAEDAPRHPVNEYGWQKVRAESFVQEYAHDWLILRPILLYGWPWTGGRDNWAVRAYRAITSGRTIQVVNDTITQPLYAGFLARVIWGMLEQGNTGIYHVAGLDTMSLYEFARDAALWLGGERNLKRIVPVPSSAFPNIAPRPVDTSYDLTKLIAAGFEPQDIKTGLMEMLSDRQWGSA